MAAHPLPRKLDQPVSAGAEGKARITVSLDPEIERRIGRLVARSGRAQAFFLRELVERSLDDVEDCCCAEAASERIRRGEAQTIPWEQLKKELGLDG